jgi:hypothetical protein
VCDVLQALPATAQAGGNQQAGGLGLSLSRGWAAGEEGQQGAAGAGGEGGEEHTRVSWLRFSSTAARLFAICADAMLDTTHRLLALVVWTHMLICAGPAAFTSADLCP